MVLDAKAKRISVRGNREHGAATKVKIIETAGRLFAEKGYAETTSKEICEAAEANVTAINYHFGSREGLFIAVLETMHHFLASPESLVEIEQGALPPREKLNRVIGRLVAILMDNTGWQTRLWAREIVTPTPFAHEYLKSRGVGLVRVVTTCLCEITGLPEDDPRLSFCYLNVMSPFMILLILGKDRPSPHSAIYTFDRETIVERMKGFIFAGLDSFIAELR